MSRHTPKNFGVAPKPPPCAGRCRTEIWVWKGVALHGGVAATVAGVALHCATKLRGCQTPAQHWIKILHPWVQEFYPVLGLGSRGIVLGHFQTLRRGVFKQGVPHLPLLVFSFGGGQETWQPEKSRHFKQTRWGYNILTDLHWKIILWRTKNKVQWRRFNEIQWRNKSPKLKISSALLRASVSWLLKVVYPLFFVFFNIIA